MEVQCLSTDKFSTLPQDITGKILILLPTTRDIVRMSILSRKWRYCWRSIPALTFANKFLKTSCDNKKIVNFNHAKSLLRILRVYMCPILELTLFLELEMFSEIDNIILNLSRRTLLNHFNLTNFSPIRFKLPSSFFSLQGLENIKLSRCVIKPPSKFNVFSTLRFLYLSNIKISVQNLKRVLSNCPLLKEFYLVGDTAYITGGRKLTLYELFECLPSLVLLAISYAYMKYFAASGWNNNPSNPQVHIRFIDYGVSPKEQEDLFSFYVIKNSPNLAKINLRLLIEASSMNISYRQDFPGFNLDHLEELDMVSTKHSYADQLFVTRVMAKSPLLKKVRIQLNDNMSEYNEQWLRDMIRWPQIYPRASPSLKFIIERSETSS